MDAKDLRTEAVLSERSSDGSSKYSHMGTALPCSVNKNYPEISSNPLAKVDTPTSRPCAVIGPDRVVPPSINTDAYLKKSHYEPWLPTESTFRHPPEYPHKTYQSPIRNISPRQTFQENMQRIMVAPSYNTMKMNEEANFGLDRNASLPKNKLGSSEPKYCDVPYSINHLSDHQKNTEMSVSNMNNVRNCPPMWHPPGVNMRPARPYVAPELYQFSDYASCAGPRPMPVTRPPHRTMNEESSLLYPEGYYHHGNVRFKPYPNVKERYPQGRYEYVNNYPNPFHPPPPFPHKYDLHKPVPSLPSYPQVPIKYLENRMNDPVIDGYQRPNQQINYNAPYQNQMLHPAYGPVLPNSLQSKLYPYPQDKTVSANKLPYENNKMYLDYDSSRNKGFPDNFYVNDNISRSHMKSQVIIPNYPTMNLPPHPYYRKDNHSGKGYDYVPHYRSVDPTINTNHLTRMASQFSPNGIAISPSDSNTSNDTAHTHGTSLEDCGYVSQSSTASVRSIESGFHRIMPNDIHRRYNYGYPSMVRASPFATKVQSNVNHNISSKDKKGIDVRQFLQMWNEGDDENAGNSKETQIDFRNDSNKCMSQFEGKTQEQLYVLGLVNVPSEELGKYEHIQKVSKLPENIKGYNNIELLKHFEEAIESSNLNDISKTSTPRNFQSPRNSIPAGVAIPARPISPLDVEAKISQSVIHKEVGCNFEIRPCSPEMLNVQVATPVKNILEERVIEKVSNPYQSPTLSNLSDNGRNCNASKQDHVIMLNENAKIPSCKLINTQCLNSDVVNVIRPDYSLHDLESNSGVCLASLPRLDNDIELNFPEVNQQFINANKDSVITPKELHGLSEANNSIYQKDEINISDNSYKTKETEKEFSKLSKYRKNKKSETEPKEQKTITNSQFMRTDSVIIKNPENIKYFVDSTEYSSNTATLDKEQEDILNSSPTITSPSSYVKKNDDILKEPDNEMAIDFSINKSKTILEIETNILDGDNSKSSYTVNDNMLIDENIQSNEIAVDTTTLHTALTTTKTLTEYNNISLTEMNNSSKKSSACIIEESVAKTIADKNTTQELDENIAKETLNKMSTENKDTSLVEINNSSKKKSVSIIEESVSETIAHKNITHKLDVDIAKETLTHKYTLESDLCLSSSDSLYKKTEDNMIVEDDQETPDARKEPSNLNKNSNEQGTHFDIDKNRSIACILYSSATELGAYNTIDEDRTSRSDDVISAEPEIMRKSNIVYAVSPLRASDEQMNISNDSNLVQRLSQTTDENCHFNSLEDSAYESASLTYGLKSDSINNGCKIKNCNLKKRLFSPWIQKLILQNENNMLKSVLINKFFTKTSRAYYNSPEIDCSKSSSCTEDFAVCNPSINVSRMPNNMGTIIHAIEDKIENFTERREDVKSPITQIKTLVYSSNTVCEENKFVPLNEIEENERVQSTNIEKSITQNTCSKNDVDEEYKAFDFNSTLKLPVSPDNPTDMSSIICEDKNKKEIKFSTDPSVLVQLPNILSKTFFDGSKNEVRMDIDYDEPIKMTHSENIPESILNEDCRNSSLSVQSEAIKLLYIPKIARSECCINKYKTNVDLNEQSLVQSDTSIEERNNVHSDLKVKIERAIEPNQKKINGSVNLIYKSKTENELSTGPSKVIHFKETENSENIVKENLNDSEDLDGKSKGEMKPTEDAQAQETKYSENVLKEILKDSEVLDGKNKRDIKPTEIIHAQETQNSENIVKENLKNNEDLDGKSKGEIKLTEDTKARETKYSENLLKENLKDSEDLDDESKRYARKTEVIQIQKTKNSDIKVKENHKGSTDLEDKSKDEIKPSYLIQLQETKNSENKVKENLKDNKDLDGKSKGEIKLTEDTKARETKYSENLLNENRKDSEDLDGKSKRDARKTEVIQTQETKNSDIIVKENHKCSTDLEDKSKDGIKPSYLIQLQETENSENKVKENLTDSEDLNGKSKGEIKPTEDAQAQETKYSKNVLNENRKDSEVLDGKNKRDIKPTEVIHAQETENSENIEKENLKNNEDLDGKSKGEIKLTEDTKARETMYSENLLKEDLMNSEDLDGKSKRDTRPTEVIQTQETKNSEHILKENLKDSENLDGKSKRIKTSNVIQVQDTENSEDILKENLKASEDLDGKSNRDTRPTEVIQTQETKNSENILKENLKDSEDLDGKSKRIIKTSNVIQVQDTENSEDILKENLKASEDLDGKSNREIKASNVIQARETENSENILQKNIINNEDLEGKRKEIKPSKVIQVPETENYGRIKENLKDSEDQDGKRKTKIEPCKGIRVQETESLNNVDNENLKQIYEQNIEDSIILTELSNLPNITHIPKNNLPSDDFKIVHKEKSLPENYEVMQSPITSIDNNTSDILHEDDNSFSVLSERNGELNFNNSSKTLIKGNIEKSSIISIENNTNDICDVLHEDDNSFSILSERNVELNLNDPSETPIKGNIENIQDTQHHTIVVTDDQSISRVLEDISFFQNSSNNIKPEYENSLENRRQTLKRSLSDSALNIINTDLSEEYGNGPLTWSKKRRKNNEFLKICNSNFVTESVCNIQNNRRNSISSVYNEENLSFCIVIEDDCIITQENEGKICFAEVSEDDYPEVQKSNCNEADIAAPTKMLSGTQTDSCEISEPFVLEISDENAFEESWVDDIGCVETVVSDDIAEDVTISAPSSPQDENMLENETSDIFNGSYGHTDKVKHFYGGQMCNDDAELVETLYRTPQMNVNKTLSNRESHITDEYEELDEYNSVKNNFQTHGEHSIDTELKDKCDENVCTEYFNKEGALNKPQDSVETCKDIVCMGIDNNTTDIIKTQDITVNSCESSIDNVFLYNQESDSLNFETQSSPEVSSTTSEEKSSSLLLKITNYKGMRTSQLNEINVENSSSNCCKFTENINYTSLNNSSKTRTLITKGAQKYIPPLIEPSDDLKVKLPLPPQSLLKLKQLKISKTMAKQSSSKINDACKKPKPRFEDVLKSIDEIQFKMHKEKSRKLKKSIPKVVIKKNENGSHYASMPNKSYFNPDLTGRKWQPWVFIEKDSFIDKMAIKKKTKAIFSHRQNTYVFADKFQKYKSESSAKFIISQPKLDDSSMGHLKYTIRLKHTY